MGVPHLSLKTADPSTSIEISGKTSTAWVKDAQGKTTIVAYIGAEAARRRLSLVGGETATLGRCIANGACIYSKSELLELRAEGRRLMGDSYFDAHADIVTYEVSADTVFSSLSLPDYRVYGEMVVPDMFTIRFAYGTDVKGMYFLGTDNATLVVPGGTYTFNDDSTNLTKCKLFTDGASFVTSLENLLRDDVAFTNAIVVSHLEKGEEPPAGFMVRLVVVGSATFATVTQLPLPHSASSYLIQLPTPRPRRCVVLFVALGRGALCLAPH